MDSLQKVMLILGRLTDDEVVDLVKAGSDIEFILTHVSPELKERIINMI